MDEDVKHYIPGVPNHRAMDYLETINLFYLYNLILHVLLKEICQFRRASLQHLT